MTKDTFPSQVNQFIQVVVVAGGAMTFNEWMMLAGIVFSAGSFFVNWYYKHQEDKRNEKDHQTKGDK